MRRGVLPGLILLSLSGCSRVPLNWLSPDPKQAWIDLRPRTQTYLQAVTVNQQPVEDNRYLQVRPGARQLEVQVQFTVQPENVGGEQAISRSCRLSVQYADFIAGGRYYLESGGYGFRPWAKLYDEHNNLLSQAKEQGCGNA